MIPHTGFLRRHLEAALLLLAARILIGRDTSRSGVVSRRDNNDVWATAERLEDIARRIKREYK